MKILVRKIKRNISHIRITHDDDASANQINIAWNYFKSTRCIFFKCFQEIISFSRKKFRHICARHFNVGQTRVQIIHIHFLKNPWKDEIVSFGKVMICKDEININGDI